MIGYVLGGAAFVAASLWAALNARHHEGGRRDVERDG